MTNQTATPLPAGVDPEKLDEALREEIRVIMARRNMTRSQLLDKIGSQLGDDPPPSYMWLHRRVGSGEVPLVRPEKMEIKPAEINDDLALIAKALGLTPKSLLDKAARNVKQGDR